LLWFAIANRLMKIQFAGQNVFRASGDAGQDTITPASLKLESYRLDSFAE
jgi:hypothetical protein